MGDIIVIQFTTLDGVISDPDGRWGTDHGGWAFRHGAGPVSDDRFRLGGRTCVHLYGRRTWEHFARLWPGRDGDYATVMNTVPKRVATRAGIDADAWQNSAAISGDLVAWVLDERTRRDVVVIGSLSVVHTLAAADAIDEYRLITFPTVIGAGDRLFAAGTPASTSAILDDFRSAGHENRPRSRGEQVFGRDRGVREAHGLPLHLLVQRGQAALVLP